MVKAKAIPQSFLDEIDYDPETGILTWKISRRGVRAGSVAGNADKGRIFVMYKYVKYYAHRVAWTKMHGPIPDGVEIDHININGLDNRKANLRPATSGQNGCNKHKRSHAKTSSLKGVSWNKGCGKWVAQIASRRVSYHLGVFDNEQDAHAAYVRAAIEKHGKFARAA